MCLQSKCRRYFALRVGLPGLIFSANASSSLRLQEYHPGASPSGQLAIAVSFDDQPLQVITVFTPATFKEEDFLGRKFGRNNTRVVRVKQMINAGKHIFKIHMTDRTEVLTELTELTESFCHGPAVRAPRKTSVNSVTDASPTHLRRSPASGPLRCP